jgi:hypothetical protein
LEYLQNSKDQLEVRMVVGRQEVVGDQNHCDEVWAIWRDDRRRNPSSRNLR